jgi:hypothetical protein
MLKKLYRFLAPKWQVLYMEYKVQFKPRYGHGKPPHKGLYDYINSQRLNFKEIIDVALSHRAYFATIPKHQLPSDQITPYYINGFLPGLDISTTFTCPTTTRNSCAIAFILSNTVWRFSYWRIR